MGLSGTFAFRLVVMLLFFVLVAGIAPGFDTVAASNSSANQGVDITTDFTDQAFLSIVRDLVGKPTGPIYDIDVANFEGFTLCSEEVTSCSGLEHFKRVFTYREIMLLFGFE